MNEQRIKALEMVQLKHYAMIQANAMAIRKIYTTLHVSRFIGVVTAAAFVMINLGIV